MGTVTGCTSVALPALLLNIVSCLESVVPFPDFTRGLAVTHVIPWGSTCSSVSMSFTLLRERTIWTIFNQSSTDSHRRCSMPFFAASDFHLVQWHQLSRIWVTIEGVWVGNQIYWPLTTRSYLCTRYFTHSAIPYSTYLVFSVSFVFTSSLVTASIGRCSPSSVREPQP
jgi:hypothetical protein